jgi:hypothetical protein
MKKCGNPHWGHPGAMAAPIERPTSFEGVTKSLGLSVQEFEGSTPLKEWARRNKDHKYVPLELLQAWGFSVN